MSGISLNDAGIRGIEVIYYASGVMASFLRGYYCLQKAKRLDNDISLNNYHGYFYEMKNIALLFLVAAIGMLGAALGFGRRATPDSEIIIEAVSERASDIRDLGRRVLMYLQADAHASPVYPEHTILIGDEVTAGLPASAGDVERDAREPMRPGEVDVFDAGGLGREIRDHDVDRPGVQRLERRGEVVSEHVHHGGLHVGPPQRLDRRQIDAHHLPGRTHLIEDDLQETTGGRAEAHPALPAGAPR